MKKIMTFILLAWLLSTVVNAQQNDITISGPTCIGVGDTVTYKVNKALPGYHWGSPQGLSWLFGSADGAAATYVVQNLFMSAGSVWYGPYNYTSKGAVALPIYARAEKPSFYLTTEAHHGQVVQQIAATMHYVYLNIYPSLQPTVAVEYELSSDNTLWTFGNDQQTNFANAKSILAQRIKLNTGPGKATINIKTTGACDSRVDRFELIKL